jgi:hypothetical protein
VLRAIVTSIVLITAAGQNAALLCRTWCDTRATATGECHHQDSSEFPAVAGAANCDDEVVGGATFVREDVRRDVSSLNSAGAIPVARFQFAPSPTGGRPGLESGRCHPLERSLLATTLRI